MSESLSERALTHELEPRIAALVTGVLASPKERDELIPDLEGEDNGLYLRLTQLASNLGEVVEDNDELTRDILKDGRKGLRKQFYSGMVLMVKQGSPLDMTATLAHEHGHRYTDDVFDEAGMVVSETIAEGAAFVVCDYFGLDISARSFPYIAGYSSGGFTPEMVDGIRTASLGIIEGLLQSP